MSELAAIRPKQAFAVSFFAFRNLRRLFSTQKRTFGCGENRGFGGYFGDDLLR
jgi:hypothetical protein